jgi:hypothetical protein
LNILTGLGYFFTGIGILVLFAALFIGTAAYDAVSAIPSNPNTGNQLGQAAFLAAFTPYGIISGVLIFLGVIFAVVENSKSSDASVNPRINVSTPYGNKLPLAKTEIKSSNTIQKSPSHSLDENELPLPNQEICPSCSYPIVFIEKYQRWYCVNERKYI